MTIAAEVLTASLANLGDSDRAFATSLLNSYKAGRMSAKQAYWIEVLAGRATKGAAPATPAPAAIGDMSGLYALFQKAARNLKRPAIVAMSPVGEIRLSVAGANARVPGSINVAEKGPYGEARYYGRIMQDGTFARRDGATDALVDYLVDFAANPAKMAAAHGHKTGACCFCNRPLTDARSTSVGYGPICAGHYGLPWGEVEAEEQVAIAA